MLWFYEFFGALPLMIVLVIVLVRWLQCPTTISILELAYIFYCLQFAIGPFLLGSPREGGETATGILMFWATANLFWLSAFILSRVIRSPLPMVWFQGKRGMTTGRGVPATFWLISSNVSPIVVYGLFAMIMAVRLFMHLKYGIVIAGTWGLDELHRVPYLIRSLYQIVDVSAAGLAAVAVFMLWRRPWTLMIWAPVLLMESAFAFTQGRRIIFAVIVLFALCSAAYRMRIRVKEAVIGTIVIIFLIGVVFPVFLEYREQRYRTPNNSTISNVVAAGVQLSTTTALFERQESMFIAAEGRLTANRIAYSIGEQFSSGSGNPTMGKLLASGVMSSLPNILFPWKGGFVVHLDDAIADNFNLPDTDYSGNLVLSAFLDLPFLGGILYGLIFAGVIRIVELLVAKSTNTAPEFGALILSAFILGIAMQMEHNPTDLFERLRAVIILWIMSIGYGLVRNMSQGSTRQTLRQPSEATNLRNS